jgi:hypothetical protein
MQEYLCRYSGGLEPTAEQRRAESMEEKGRNPRKTQAILEIKGTQFVLRKTNCVPLLFLAVS